MFKKYVAALFLITICENSAFSADTNSLSQPSIMSDEDKTIRLQEFKQECEKLGVELNEDEIKAGRLNLYSKLRDITPLTEVWNNLLQLSWLTSLSLSANELQAPPNGLWNLVNLRELFLHYNQLITLPSELRKLVNLESFYLFSNQLQNIPLEICNLVNLTRLTLAWNQLQTIPPEIGNLVNLVELELNRNQLQTIPPEIGKLVNLVSLRLSNNQLITVPSTMGNLRQIQDLRLFDLPLLPHGDASDNWGRQELRERFGYRVALNDPTVESMPAATTEAEVYDPLDAAPLHINRDWLSKLELPEITAPTLAGEQVITFFEEVMAGLNVQQEAQPGYVSYEMLMTDFSNGLHKKDLSNADKICQYFMPRVRGFLKTLYGLPLLEGETSGWQMYDTLKPAMKQVLSFILQAIQENEDTDMRATLVMQLANALLHCPTGQSEGLNTLRYSLLEGQVVQTEELPARLQQLIASQKNKAFQQAILLKTAENGQNVHWISFYRDQLKDILGLTAVITGYEEKIGTFGQDPFSGNKNNVLSIYYQIVTPNRLVDWVSSIVKTTEDLKAETYLWELKRVTAKATLPQGLITYLKEKKLVVEDDLIPESIQAVLEKLALTVKRNKQLRPISPTQILNYLIDYQIVTPQINDWWNGYFTADPVEDVLALPTFKSMEAILVQMEAINKLK